jgi:hypothetical protein
MNKRRLNHEARTKKNKVLILCSILVLFTVIATGLWLRQSREPVTNQPVTGEIDSDTPQTDYNPPSEDILRETEEHKEKIVNNPDTSNPPDSSKKSVKPVITFAGKYDDVIEVGSYVGEVFEDGGECKLMLTNGDTTVTRTTKGVKDVSTTLCPTFKIPASELKGGTWTAKVSYSSAAAEGASNEKSFEN